MIDRFVRRALFPLTVLAVVSTGCGSKKEDVAQAEPPPVLVGPENLFIAETRQVQNGPQLSGSLVAEREATIRAEMTGTVREVTVQEGQSVSEGQLLGRLSDEAVRDAVASAQSAVRTATEAYQVAKRNAERSEKLAQAGAVAERDLEQARWSATNAEGGLADAKARLAAAEKAWSNTQLKAPFRGIISDRQVNPGDVVQSGNPLITVVDPSSLRLEAQVPVAALASLKIGTPVPFTIDGLGNQTFEGKITRINPAVDPATRQVRIIVSLPNKTGRLVAGLFAQGRVAIESHDGVVVPSSAIDRRGVRPSVTRIQNGAAARVEVELGIEDQNADRVEVTQGLAVGDTVITGAARGIQPGTKVRPAAAAERETANRR
jgi:RND family efflux transporter MFP subunit